MKFKTRLTALMLLLSIVLACLVSCTSGNGPEDTLPTDQSGNVSDTLPENNAVNLKHALPLILLPTARQR